MRSLLIVLLGIVSWSPVAAQCPDVPLVECTSLPNGEVLVEWLPYPGVDYVSYDVRRSGVVIATVPVEQTSFIDSPPTGAYTYTVWSGCGGGGDSCGGHAGITGQIHISSESADPGSTVTVQVLLDHDAAQGFNGLTTGFSHNPTILEPISVEAGPEVLDVNGGLGPEFLELYHDVPVGIQGDSGVIVFFTGSLLGPDSMIAPGTNIVLFEITYAVNPNAPIGAESVIEVEPMIGANPVGFAYVVSAVVMAEPIDPPLPGVVVVGEASAFRPGDMDSSGAVGLADAIAMLQFLFVGMAVPCERTVDANLDDQRTLTDPIFVLQYAFASGPAPYSRCMVSPTVDCAIGTCP